MAYFDSNSIIANTKHYIEYLFAYFSNWGYTIKYNKGDNKSC